MYQKFVCGALVASNVISAGDIQVPLRRAKALTGCNGARLAPRMKKGEPVRIQEFHHGKVQVLMQPGVLQDDSITSEAAL